MMDPLVERARSGDAQALEELLESIAPVVERFGLRMCGSRSDADDVLQDTLLAVTTHLDSFEGRSSLLSWVFTLARTACGRRRRGRKNQPQLQGDEANDAVDDAPSPEDHAVGRQLASALAQALEKLPESYREVILLRDVEGLAAADAAIAVGISIDALKSRLHRARESLRDALKPLLEPSAPPSPSSCPEVVLLWSQKLEGDLSPIDCAAMERHVQHCPSCASACTALKAALFACTQSSVIPVRPAVRRRVEEAVAAWLTRTRGAPRQSS